MLTVFALVAVPFLVVPHACASFVGESSLDLVSIFRACKTGVLRVRQNDIDDGWLQYCELLPTKESVDRIAQLMPKDSVPHAHHPEKSLFAHVFSKVFRYGFGCDTAKAPQNVLMVALKKSALTEQYLAMGFLVKYAIFKALLYSGLGKEEARVLVSVCKEIPLSTKCLAEIGKLFDGLASPRCCADLLATLVSSINVNGVGDAFSAFTERWPDVVDNLVKEYIASNEKYSTEITLCLFSCLPAKSQYDLLKTRLFTWQPNLVCKRGLYVLSRFSMSSSEEVQRLCLQNSPRYQIYEEKAQQIENNLLNRMKSLNPRRIPKEIWIKILLYCDNFLFQVYIVPLVCKFWRCIHHILLSHSSTVQEALISDWNAVLAKTQAFDHRHYSYPWSYFLHSPLALFRYSLVCLENLRPEIDSRRIISCAENHWQQFVQQVDNDEYPMTPASYLGLYVRFCKILKRSLVFYQISSISDEEYIALIRKCIYMHEIIPLIPERFLEEDCIKFVQMLEHDGDLVILLLPKDPRCRNRLAICLFLTKYRIPPEVDKILSKASELYCLLRNVSKGATIQNPAEDSGAYRLACGPDLECLRRNIQEHCFGQHHENSIARELSLAIVTLLCDHCQDYSEHEFCNIQRVFELCEIFDRDSKLYAYGQYLYMLLNDPKVAVELID